METDTRTSDRREINSEYSGDLEALGVKSGWSYAILTRRIFSEGSYF